MQFLSLNVCHHTSFNLFYFYREIQCCRFDGHWNVLNLHFSSSFSHRFSFSSEVKVVKFVLQFFFFNLGQFVLTWILECTCVSSAPVHLQHFVDKHCLYLYLQRNHQSNPETVLSRWNIGVGHEPLRQNKPHSTPHPRVHTKINPTETDPVEPLCMVYWKIPDWIPTNVPFDVFICLKTEWTNAPEPLCMDSNSTTAPQWWKLLSCSSLTHHPLTIVCSRGSRKHNHSVNIKPLDTQWTLTAFCSVFDRPVFCVGLCFIKVFSVVCQNFVLMWIGACSCLKWGGKTVWRDIIFCFSFDVKIVSPPHLWKMIHGKWMR